MAGMFYSLEEVAKKLNKTEEEVKQIVKEGRLREFRDGPNLLFKVDEVEGLMSDTIAMGTTEIPAPPEQQTDQIEVLMSDASEAESKESIPSVPPEPVAEEEISLESEPVPDTVEPSEVIGSDTAMTLEETSVIGGTDTDFKLTEDTMAEAKTGSDEASLEEIEEDVNLDTFGSGSGLLDLSLQADDTSLGGILDEIYTPGDEQDQASDMAGSAVDLAAGTDQMLAEVAPSQPVPAAAAILRGYVEPEPDTMSNAFGLMLFLPLLAVVYTTIVAVAALYEVMPIILEKVQSMIWYIMGGAAVVALLIIGIAFMLSHGGTKVDKKPKVKKQKKPKNKNKQ